MKKDVPTDSTNDAATTAAAANNKLSSVNALIGEELRAALFRIVFGVLAILQNTCFKSKIE
uniref:Uncharacterized protein n=1 Tax=Romanomermis culicivorax TaxID=13658 RepID=A0A915KRL7_ROMCU